MPQLDLGALETGDVLAVHEEGLIPWLIRLRTRSQFSHVATILRLPEGLMIVQSTPQLGVAPMLLERYLTSLKGRAWVCWMDQTVASAINPTYQRAMVAFLTSRYGDLYDVPGILHYLLPFIHPMKGREYCSELAAQAMLAAGIMMDTQLSPEQLVSQPIFTHRTQWTGGRTC